MTMTYDELKTAIQDYTENDETTFVDNSGDRWYADEYGDRSYMWDYM